MSETIELNQSKNTVEVTGLLKSVNFERKEINEKAAITGNAVVEVVDGDKVNNIRVEVFSYKYTKNGTENKLYKGLVTVSDDFKTIDKHGRDEADLVRVTGKLSGNAYASNGDVIQSTRIQGTFFNRVENEDHSALAQVVLAINGFTDKMDADGMPTGTKNVEAYFVEYGNRIGKVVGLQVEGELADQFEELFAKGDTTELTMKIQNYVTKTESAKPSSGFGVQKDLGGGSFTSNFEIIGGSEAFQDGRELSEEEFEFVIAEYEKMLKAKETEGEGSKISKGATTGFGNAKTGGASVNPFGGATDQAKPNGDYAF